MAIITGTSGNNNIDGTSGSDIIFGLGGNDVINSGAGNDLIDAGAGNDTVNAGTGNDTVDGGAGDDRLDGGAGNDVLYGGTGNDTLVYTLSENSGAKDLYLGGSGTDTLELRLTQAQYNSYQSQITAYKNLLLHPVLDGTFIFCFNSSTKLAVSGLEKLKIVITDATVNGAPVNTVPVAQAVNEDTLLAFTGSKTISVNDVDGNLAKTQLSVSHGILNVTLASGASISAGANGTGSLTISGTQAQINATLATLSYQGALNYNGSDTLTVVSTDSASTPLSDTDTIAITVTAVDDASALTPDFNTVTEDNPAVGNVLSNDSDVDNALSVASFTISGDVTTYTAGQAATLTGIGTLLINGDGTYTFTPDANWNGVVPQATYTTNTGSSSTLNITVTAVDDASELLADTNSVAEDTIANGNVLTNDSDVDNALSVTSFTISGDNTVYAASGPAATITGVGTLLIDADGDYTFTPAQDWNGIVPQVTYTTNTGSTSTLYIEVTPVDDASALTPDFNTVTEDNPAVGNVLSNDSDVDNALSVTSFTISGDNTVYAASGPAATIAGVGTLLINGDGTYTFTPDANWNGVVPQATYTTNTGSSSTLDITVTSVNDAPAGKDGAVSTSVNTAYIFTANDFGFTDPNDNPANSLLAVKISGVPNAGILTNNGAAVISGQTISVTDINEGHLAFISATNGPVSLTFQVQDDGTTANGGVDLDATANTLTINVVDTTPPTIIPIIAAGSEDAASILITLFATDNVGVASFNLSTVPSNGTLYINPGLTTLVNTAQNYLASSGGLSLYFVPAANFNGAPTFNYIAQDVNGNISLSATQTITVTPVNDAPVAVADAASTDQNTPLVINDLTSLTSNDSDVENDTLTITAVNNAVHGIVLLNAGVITFTPEANYSGSASFEYTVSDGNGGTDIGTVNVTVIPTGPQALFHDDANNPDIVNFNTDVNPGQYDPASYYNALAGDDQVTLPDNNQHAIDIGYDFTKTFNAGFGSDIVTGGTGNDIIDGGNDYSFGINDRLDGGAGIDTVSYASVNAGTFEGVTVSLALQGSPQDTFNGGIDVLSNFENILGSKFRDTLTGDAGNNVIDGGAGFFTGIFNDGFGDDTLDGGLGIDTVSYQSAVVFVTVSLALQGAPQDTIGAGKDTLFNFENLIGSNFDDSLTGNAGTNTINGGAGNDIIDGGAGNVNDTLIGGAGTNTLSYASLTSLSGQTVNLSNNTSFGGGGNDSISGFENIIGSNFSDILTGTLGANIIDGGAGNDTINGNGGIGDILIGGMGADILNAGGGADQFRYNSPTESASFTSSGTGADTINNFNAVSDQLWFEQEQGPGGFINNGSAGFDTVSGGNIASANPNAHFIYDTANNKLYYDANAGAHNLNPNDTQLLINFVGIQNEQNFSASDIHFF